MSKPIVYLVHDPMCSWCWAFRPAWEEVKAQLGDEVGIQNVVGGLAPDSDDPMPLALQKSIAGFWRQIEQRVPGTTFNHAFWTECSPRRSTYPACRAVICAAKQAAEEEMILGIQQAYYLQARNPSDVDVLVDIADSIGLDVDRFEKSLASEEVEQELQRQISFARSIGGNGFPSLFVQVEGTLRPLPLSYTDASVIIEAIRASIGSLS